MNLMRFEEIDNTLDCQGIMETIADCANVLRSGKHLRFYFTDKANKIGCQVHGCLGQQQKNSLLTAVTISRIVALVPVP